MIRIITVDDDEEVVTLTTALLQSLHYCDVEIFQFLTFKTAAEFIKGDKKQIDIAIIDGMLPDGSGLELADIISQHHPNCELILQSGISDPANVSRMSALGTFLQKPFWTTDAIDIYRQAIEFSLTH